MITSLSPRIAACLSIIIIGGYFLSLPAMARFGLSTRPKAPSRNVTTTSQVKATATTRKYSLNSGQRVSAESINQLLERGRHAYEMQNYSGALTAYTAALQKDASNPRTNFGLGATYMAMQSYDLAIEHFQNALELNPALIEAYYSLALAYQASGKEDQALRVYRKALGLDIQEELPRNAFRYEVTLGESSFPERKDQPYMQQSAFSQRATTLRIEEDSEGNTDLSASPPKTRSIPIQTTVTYRKPQERKSRLKDIPQDPGSESIYSTYTSAPSTLSPTKPPASSDTIRKSPFSSGG